MFKYDGLILNKKEDLIPDKRDKYEKNFLFEFLFKNIFLFLISIFVLIRFSK